MQDRFILRDDDYTVRVRFGRNISGGYRRNDAKFELCTEYKGNDPFSVSSH